MIEQLVAMRAVRTLLLAALTALLLYLPTPSYAQGGVVLTRHTRDAIESGQAPLVGRPEASQILPLNLALPLRDQSGLESLLAAIYDPSSLSYHHFLSVEEFTQRFGPSQQDYDAVVGFARAHGLTITSTSPNRMLVNISGAVADVERAFHVTMGLYQHPTEARTFYAPDREPTPDLPFALWHITGLDNFSIPRPASLMKAAKGTGNTTGSGPGGNFIGSDLRIAYYAPYGNGTLDGSGQSIGLLEFAGYNQADVNNYFEQVNQTLSATVTGISADGSSLTCAGGCDDTEQALDIEVAISMAPKSAILVYVSDSSDIAIFNRMATDNTAKSLSCSWGWDPADPASDDPIFLEFAAQGQNLFLAAGDNGAFRNGQKFVYPGDDPYITSVGGTDLTTASAGGPWRSEIAWSYSGGGVSPNKLAIPQYQLLAGVITSANKGSLVYRNSPDVAAEANTDNFICYDGTCGVGWGGTSFAAPRWAGFLALVNQQSKAPIGFLNPTIYQMGLNPSQYQGAFHDIISGTNGKGGNGGYPAEQGYDLVTGWGSPNGTGLIKLLTPKN